MSDNPPGPPQAPTPQVNPAPAGATEVLERQQTAVEPGDAERFAHYVRKDKIVGSAVSGKPVVALCGKVWVPKRDPSRFPVCPVCQEIYQSIDKGPAGGQPED